MNLGFFRKLANHFGLALPPVQRFNKLAPIPDAMTREDRKRSRYNWAYRRKRMLRVGPPVLSGKRLERALQQCSLEHLTVPSRAQFPRWIMLHEKGITPQKRAGLVL